MYLGRRCGSTAGNRATAAAAIRPTSRDERVRLTQFHSAGWQALLQVDSGGLDGLAARIRADGDVARTGRTVICGHPDAVRELFTRHDRQLGRGPAMFWSGLLFGRGLLASTGEFHDRQRALIQPALHPKRLAAYGRVAVTHASAERDRWRDGQVVDVHTGMVHLALRVMAEALFGAAVGPEAEALASASEMNLAAFHRLMRPWGKVGLLLPTRANLRTLAARHVIRRTLRRFVANRRRLIATTGGTGRADDLLARLMSVGAADAGPDAGANAGVGQARPGMKPRQIVDESVTLFMAGHETTASALTFALWLLAHHPAQQATVRDELDDVLGDRPEPVPADLDRLGYTRMVVAETMRLFPPIWAQSRLVHRPCDLAGTPVRRGEDVMLVQWATHRDPRWWPDPLQFDPLRFSPARSAERPRWAYFPFGGGRRACVGEAFAWSETVLVLATLLRRWRVEPPADAPPLRLDPGMSLRPLGGVPLVVRG